MVHNRYHKGENIYYRSDRNHTSWKTCCTGEIGYIQIIQRTWLSNYVNDHCMGKNRDHSLMSLINLKEKGSEISYCVRSS